MSNAVLKLAGDKLYKAVASNAASLIEALLKPKNIYGVSPELSCLLCLSLSRSGVGGVFSTQIAGPAHFDPLILCDFS